MKILKNLNIIFQNFGAGQIDWDLVIDAGSDEIALVVDLASFESLRSRYDGRIALHSIPSFEFEDILSITRHIMNARRPGSTRIFTAHEDSIIPCAQVREVLGLGGPKVADVMRFRDKLLMKGRLTQLGGSLPKYIPFDKQMYESDESSYVRSCIDLLGLPIFKKPTSKAGSVGAGVLRSEEEFHTWARTVPSSETYELDQFIVGDLYHCDVFMVDGELHSSYVCRYLGPNQNYYEGKPIGSVVISSTTDHHARITAFTLQILRELEPLMNGMYHLELFEQPTGEFKFIEVACRPPGGEIPKLYSKQLNLDVRAAHYVAQIYGIVPPISVSERYYAALWFPKIEGNFVSLIRPDLEDTQVELERVAPFGPMSKSETFGQRSAEALLSSARWNDLDASFRSLHDFSPLKFLP